MNGRAFLNVANTLIELGKEKPEDEEALYRSSISRSYYAVYNSTVKWCRVKKVKNIEDKEHYDLFNALKADKNISKNIKNVATIGNDLRVKRNDADYLDRRANTKFDRQQSLICYRRAKAALDTLDKNE